MAKFFQVCQRRRPFLHSLAFLVSFNYLLVNLGVQAQAPSWYHNFPPWWINANSMPPGYEHNTATVGALHPPNSYDAQQGAKSRAWFLGFQNYAKMHSIVPPANRPPVSVQAMEAMLNPDALGHSKNDLFAAVSGHSLIPTNRPGIYGGILSAHLANSGLAHLNGDGILANPLAVQESTQLHQQVSRVNNNILPGTFTKEQRSTGLGITMTHHVHPAAGVPHFKSNNVNLVKAPATMLRGNKKRRG